MVREDDELGLPEGLKGELRGLYGPGRGFDGGRDAGILAAAREAGRRRMVWRRWVLSGAVAAVVGVAVGLPFYLRSGTGGGASYVRTGDVRDAFYVARELKRGHGVGLGLDENRDGKVDGADVRLLAMAAVRVESGR